MDGLSRSRHGLALVGVVRHGIFLANCDTTGTRVVKYLKGDRRSSAPDDEKSQMRWPS